MNFFGLVILILYSQLPFLGFSIEKFDPHLLPRPLILENPENLNTHCEEPPLIAREVYAGPKDTQFVELEEAVGRVRKTPGSADSGDDVTLRCTSWRVAAEANNLNPWKAIPQECLDYVKQYMTGRGYVQDLERVSEEARTYATSVALRGDGMDVWVFDVDDTLLSNLPYYQQHGYGSEIFNPEEFDKWVEQAMAPPIEPSLKFYGEVLDLGFKIFLLTGRRERQRTVTIDNLIGAGFQHWDKLIMRTSDDHGKLAVLYKSEKRNEMVNEGYRIHGNSGDQWSDLLGSPMPLRSFKLPNPMYYIP